MRLGKRFHKYFRNSLAPFAPPAKPAKPGSCIAVSFANLNKTYLSYKFFNSKFH